LSEDGKVILPHSSGGRTTAPAAADAGAGGHIAGVAEHRQDVLHDAIRNGVHADLAVPFHPQRSTKGRPQHRRGWDSCIDTGRAREEWEWVGLKFETGEDPAHWDVGF